jgi:hypothetical protein
MGENELNALLWKRHQEVKMELASRGENATRPENLVRYLSSARNEFRESPATIIRFVGGLVEEYHIVVGE